MDITFTGVIQKAFQLRTGVSQRSGNQWQSQEFLIQEIGVQYPQSLVFNVFGAERLQTLNLKVGDEVTAHLNFSTRVWQDRYFTQIDCFRVDRPGQEQPQQQAQQPQQAAPAAQAAPQAQAPAAQPAQQPAPAEPAQDDDTPF